MEMSIVDKAVIGAASVRGMRALLYGATSVRGMRALLYGATMLVSIFMVTPATGADDSVENFTRIAWLSRCEVHEQEEYFFIDLFPDGLLRYEGVTDVKILGTREERLDGRTLRRLRSAIRDFLAGKADADQEDNGPTFCVRVQVYKASKVVDVRSELIYANHLPAALQRINQTASPGRWACPARLSSTRSGSRSARFCYERPAFMMHVEGKSVCDLSRHVEVYMDGSVYIATRVPPAYRLIEHDFYQINSAAVAKLIDTINTFEVISMPAFEDDPTLIYRRKRPEDIEELKNLLSELIGVKWTSLEGAASCEPSGAISEVSLRSDLDRAMKEEVQYP